MVDAGDGREDAAPVTGSCIWLALLVLCAVLPAAGQETVIAIAGEVPGGPETHFFLPFEVPEGIAEIEVRHDDLSDENILDRGLDDPDGFRGWGGGNNEPAIVGREAASRSYLPGPMPAGMWEVVVGKAKVSELPARYSVEVVLRTEPTLAPQEDRLPYADPARLDTGPRWYAGDFHVHSRESGDARPTIERVLEFADSRRLDFVMLAEHNTTSQLSLYDAAQAEAPNVLLLPGIEYTTYSGHANAIGVTEWLDHRLGVRGATVADAVTDIHAQGGLLSINHPLLNVGDLCIGCGWNLDVDPAEVDAVEVQTGVFRGVSFWEELVSRGSRAVPIGGSDDHRGGLDPSPTNSQTGTPTTMVYADELSVAGIVDGLRAGRTVVIIEGPDGPMVDSDISGRRRGDTVFASTAMVGAAVSGGDGLTLRTIRNGEILAEVAVAGDSFEHEIEVRAPDVGEDHYRHELVDGDRLVTLTSYTWLRLEDATEDDSCAVSGPRGTVGPAWLLLGVAVFCATLRRLRR